MSEDLIERLRTFVHGCDSIRDAAARLNLPRSSVHEWYHRHHKPTTLAQRALELSLDVVEGLLVPTDCPTSDAEDGAA